jgi:hypothetical protein
VQLLLAPFSSPLVFIIFTMSIFLAVLIVAPSLRSAVTSEGRGSRWARALTGINAKYAFTLLFVLWALFFGILLQLVPQIGANSPYGSIGLVALFSGVFVMMGLLWAVIRD